MKVATNPQKSLWPYILVFILALVPRAVGLNIFLTVDETGWVGRSVEFFTALLNGQPVQDVLPGHPGVTTVWSAVSGLLARYLLQGQDISLLDFLGAVPTETVDPDYLVALRFPTVLLTALCVVGVYHLVKKLFKENEPVALLSAILLALDPFYLVYSRLLDQDALLSGFIILSLLSFLVYLQGEKEKKRYLIVSGLMAGLAALSKSSALFLGPFVGLLAAVCFVARFRERSTVAGIGLGKEIVRWLVVLALWLFSAALIYVALWPAMWGDPAGTLVKTFLFAFKRVTIRRKEVFFWGQITEPGLLFYPVVVLFRMTPLTTIGVAALLMGMKKGPFPGREEKRERACILALIVYVVLFVLFASTAGYKYDYYVLPVFPALDILAAIGLWNLCQVAGSKFRVRTRPLGLILAGLALQAAFVLPYEPYYSAFYNPLLGGGREVIHVLMLGQGEGLDEAARYLNDQPGATDTKVAAWHRGCFASFFQGETWELTKRSLFWKDVDYAVLYANQVQRQLPDPQMVSYFRSLEAEHVVRVKGIDYAWVYKVPKPLADVLLPFQHVARLKFGDEIMLIGYDFYDGRLESEGALDVTLYWQALHEIKWDYHGYLKLINGVYQVWGEQAGRPAEGASSTSFWKAGQITEDRREIKMWPGTPPGEYRVVVRLYDPYHDQELLPNSGEELILAPVQIVSPPFTDVAALDVQHPFRADLAGMIRLLGYNLESGFRPGDGLHLTLFWQALSTVEQDYTVFTHLIDEQNHIWAQKDSQPAAGFYPTSRWRQEEVVRDQYDLIIPADIAVGRYFLEIGLYSAATGERLPAFGPEGERLQDDRIELAEIRVRF